jgi:Flp pilus assembly protein TadG
MHMAKLKKGQAVVEFVLLFPFFLLVIVGGIVDFGFAFYNLISLQQIANDAAQYATVAAAGPSGRSDADIQTFINQRKPSWWQGTFTVTTALTSSSTTPQIKVDTLRTADNIAPVKRITLQYNSPMYTPFYHTLVRLAGDASGLRIQAGAAFQIPQNR